MFENDASTSPAGNSAVELGIGCKGLGLLEGRRKDEARRDDAAVVVKSSFAFVSLYLPLKDKKRASLRCMI